MPRATLDDLFAERAVPDAAISPSGRYLALVLRDGARDQVVSVDLEQPATAPVMRIAHDAVGAGIEARISSVTWKTDDRLLVRTRTSLADERRKGPSIKEYESLGVRLFAVDRDGTHRVRFLEQNRDPALRGTLNLGAIASFLPNDPDHVLMYVNGFRGPSLVRVDVHTGIGEVTEPPNENIFTWIVDTDGHPVVRVDVKRGSVVFLRKEAGRNWKQFYSIRLRELKERPDYEPVGPSDQEGKIYVLARPPGRDRIGLYLYDLEHEVFGEPVFEHPQYDLDSAEIARDGLDLGGYLTWPAGAKDARDLPLVVYPHGGPEMRDQLDFDPWAQYLAARGYAVFQPNFRGSGGFGTAFAERGYGQWGRSMQDDVSDGVAELVRRGIADPKRICIVGASYGGYAALAGVALTPELYRCAVSVAGISDLEGFIMWRRKEWGADSEGYTYWFKAIGNPRTDAARLESVSPARLAEAIRAPVLLIHGTEDSVVPFEQSKKMQKALARAGRPAELLTIEGEDHSYWSDANEKRALIAVDRFLWANLGPGHDVSTPPPEMPAEAPR